jgi:hypothetical protein
LLDQQAFERRDLPEYVLQHLATLAKLHAANRYDRRTNDVERITGKPATMVQEFVRQHVSAFAPSPSGDRPGAALSGVV